MKAAAHLTRLDAAPSTKAKVKVNARQGESLAPASLEGQLVVALPSRARLPT